MRATAAWLVAGVVLAGCPQEPAEGPDTAETPEAVEATATDGCIPNKSFPPAYPDVPRCKGMGFANQCCPVTAAELSWEVPIDTCVFAFNGWHFEQPDLDHFSWLSFIALNWPADLGGGRGVANQGARPQGPTPGAGNATTVWQTYKDLSEVFPATGKPSKDWNAPPPPPPSICPDLPGAEVLQMTSKASSTVSSGGLMALPADTASELGGLNQAFTGPLVDRAGNLVLYDIKINETEFETITTHGFNTGTKVPKDFLFKTDEIGEDGRGPDGSLEVKAAWKQLSDEEWATGSYFQQEALFYYPGDSATKAFCEKVKIGLVGFHISHKIENIEVLDETTKKPVHQWVWSTFEHVGNVPTNGDGGGPYSFYDASCQPAVTAAECAALTKLPVPDEKYRCCQNLWRWQKIGNGGDPYSMPRTADQVTRIDPLAADANCSEIYLSALAGTVWENYFLVGTQWIDPGADNPTIPPVVTPKYLRNTTLETYFAKWEGDGSGGFRQVNRSSCDGCHSGGIDHSYIFLAAGVD